MMEENNLGFMVKNSNGSYTGRCFITHEESEKIRQFESGACNCKAKIIDSKEDPIEYEGNILVGVRNKSLRVAIVKPGTKVIGRHAFVGCNNLTTVILPPRLNRICEEAFLGCSSLKSINLPDVRWIETRAFASCAELRNIYLPASVIQIGEGFIENSGVEFVSVCSTLKDTENVFSNAPYLKWVNVFNAPNREGVIRFTPDSFSGWKYPFVNLPDELDQWSIDGVVMELMPTPPELAKKIHTYQLKTAITIPSEMAIIPFEVEALASRCMSSKQKPCYLPKTIVYADEHAYDSLPGAFPLEVYAQSEQTSLLFIHDVKINTAF